MELAKYMIGDTIINGSDTFEAALPNPDLLFDKLPNKTVEKYYRALQDILVLEKDYLKKAKQVGSTQAPEAPLRVVAQNKQSFFAEAVGKLGQLVNYNPNDVDVDKLGIEIQSSQNRSEQVQAKQETEALDKIVKALATKKKELLTLFAIQTNDLKEEANIKRYLLAKLYERAYFNNDNTDFSLISQEGYIKKNEVAVKLINEIEASVSIKEIVLYNLDKLWEKVVDGLGYLEDLYELVSEWFEKAPAIKKQVEEGVNGSINAIQGKFDNLRGHVIDTSSTKNKEVAEVEKQEQAKKLAEQKLPEADVESSAIELKDKEEAELDLAEEALDYFMEKLEELAGGSKERERHLVELTNKLSEYLNNPVDKDLYNIIGTTNLLYENVATGRVTSKIDLLAFDADVKGKLEEYEMKAKELKEVKSESVQLKR